MFYFLLKIIKHRDVEAKRIDKKKKEPAKEENKKEDKKVATA